MLESRIRIIKDKGIIPWGYKFVDVALPEHLFAHIGKYTKREQFLLLKDDHNHYAVYVKL